MKRIISAFLAFVIAFGVCVSMPCLKTEAKAVSGSQLFTVKTSGFENGKITYRIYYNAGVRVMGSCIHVDFDPSKLAIDKENSGEYYVTDEYGDSYTNVDGLFVADFVVGSDSSFSMAHISVDELYFSKTKQVFQVVFTAKGDEIEETFVEFHCGEFNTSDKENEILFGQKKHIATMSTIHTHSCSNWTVEKKPTCITEGRRKGVCETCDKEFFEVMPVAGHSYDEAFTVDVAPTCTRSGSKSRHCTVCGAKTDVTEIEPTGHNESDWIYTPGTCMKFETRHIECMDCGEKLVIEEFSLGDHVESDWIIDVPSTCVSEGTKHKECAECGKVLVTDIINFAEHTPSDWITDKKATVNTAGEKHKECTVCGEVLETATIPQLKCSAVTVNKVANVTTGVRVYWSKVTGADSYRIYRRLKGGSWKAIGNTTKAYYTDKTAKSGTTYYYCVRALNEVGLGAACKTTKSIKCLADPTLKVPTSAKSGISLKWTKTAGASGYVIYRKAGNGSFKKLVTEKGVSNLSYIDKSAKKGTTYTYKIRAYYGSTYSAYSNTRQIKDKY